MYRFVITELPDGREVFVNLINSAAGHYLSRQPYVINLIKEVLRTAELKAAKVTLEHDMGRVIGKTDIIETTDKDIIYYAQPFKQTVFSRYAKNRYPVPSQKLTIIMHKSDDNSYELIDTWIGQCSPPFPGHEEATAKSLPYWQTHALVQDAQLVQTKTITRDCPY